MMDAAIEKAVGRMVAVALDFRARRLKYIVQHPGQINDETQWPPEVSREAEARALAAAFLDAVKDSPTEEMLEASVDTKGAQDLAEACSLAALHGFKTWSSRGEEAPVRQIWRAMCLALRRGVADEQQQVKP